MSGGSTIQKAGTTYFCNGKTYNLVGNTLFGPNEQSWFGDIDDTSARDIISRNQ